jgi:hypothetical protein
MLEQWRQKQAEKKVVKELLKNPIVQAGRDAINAYLTDYPELRKQHSKEFIDNVGRQLMARGVQVAGAANPVAANREQLVGMTFAAAQFQVLVLEPPPVPDPTGLRGRLGISGELRAHLVTLVPHILEIEDLMHGLPAEKSFANVADMCLIRYRQCHFAMTIHHALRYPLDDYNPNGALDWFRPLYLTQCAAAEWQYRNKLGLPNNDPQAWLEYSTLANFVESDAKWPDLAWEKHYGKPLPRLPSA